MVGGWLLPGLLLVALAVAGFWLMRRRVSPVLPHCPQCGSAVQSVYFRCPRCGATLKRNCPGCSRVVEYDWDYCCHCGRPMKRHQAGETAATAGANLNQGEES